MGVVKLIAIHSAYGLDTSCNPLGRSRSILLVLAMRWGDNDATITDVIPLPAINTSTRRGNSTKGLAPLRVTKGNSCTSIKSVKAGGFGVSRYGPAVTRLVTEADNMAAALCTSWAP
jgi:hypothetical protein